MQRTIRRTGLAHVDNKGIIDRLWRGEMKVHWPDSEGGPLGFRSGRRRNSSRRDTTRSRGRQGASHQGGEVGHGAFFERFLTEGNERADELAKYGAMLDGREMMQIRASTVQQKREEGYAALQHAPSFHCLVEEWQDSEELKPQAELRYALGMVCSNEQIPLHQLRERTVNMWRTLICRRSSLKTQ